MFFLSNGFKLLAHVESKTSQFETGVVKSLVRFNTQYKVNEGFKLLLAMKVKKTWQ